MGKKRGTAKTGDQAIYKSRESYDGHKGKGEDDNDPMYNEVDRFHNAREENYIKFDRGTGSDEDEDEDSEEEAVMNLAVGGESSEDESSSEDELSDEEAKKKSLQRKSKDSSSETDSSSSSSDEEDDEMDKDDVRDWGKKKSAYYHGDTADLEIGQDKEDAHLEEEAAKEVQAARYKDMSEEDFMLSDAEEQDNDCDDKSQKKNDITGKDAAVLVSAAPDLSKLSTKEKQKFLNKKHPELLPLLTHFSTVVQELNDTTSVASRALFEGEEGTAEAVGASKMGQQYLLTKALLQSSTALNLAIYLLLKSEQSQQEEEGAELLIQSHPVLARLEKWNSLAQKLEDRVENKVNGLQGQIENLVKASAFLKSGDMESESDSDEQNENEGSDGSVDGEGESVGADNPVGKKQNQASTNDDFLGGVEQADLKMQNAASQNVLNEARFGLRPSEVSSTKTKTNKAPGGRPRQQSSLVSPSDFGDSVSGIGDSTAPFSQSLASTLNAIEQRSATRKRRVAPSFEGDIVAPLEEDDDGELRRGLQMMEEELGKDDDSGDLNAKSDEEEADEMDMDGGFYEQVKEKSISNKQRKKSLYQVAPKYPRLEGLVEGERAISKTILQNRGLVAHKSKLNRNPRVKKREQYRKALIRRKGAVREVRTDEGHKYGGEDTGIKSGLSRSRKLSGR